MGCENGRGAQRRGTGRARGCRVANAPERIERLEQAAKLAASIAEIKRAEAGEKKKKQVDAASSLVTHAPTAAAKLEKKGGDVLKLTIKDIRALLVVAYGEESPATISKSAAVTTFNDAIKADPLGLAKIDKVAEIKDSTPLIPVDAEQGGTLPGALDDDDDDDEDPASDADADERRLRDARAFADAGDAGDGSDSDDGAPDVALSVGADEAPVVGGEGGNLAAPIYVSRAGRARIPKKTFSYC